MEHDWNPMKHPLVRLLDLVRGMDNALILHYAICLTVIFTLSPAKLYSAHTGNGQSASSWSKENTLEEKVMRLQRFKVSVANAVISSENASLKTMNTSTPASRKVGLVSPASRGRSRSCWRAASSIFLLFSYIFF